MNFYASRGFLDAAAQVYFKGRDTAIRDVRIGDDVLRLLVVDGKKPVTRLLFLDYHQPLTAAEITGPVHQGRCAQRVSRHVIEAVAWDGKDGGDDHLAPFVDWTRYGQFAAYREFLLERFHGLVRDRERRGRALESRYGRVVFTMDDHAADILAMARQWKGQQLREIGLPDFFDDPRTCEFLECLRERGHLVSSTLRTEGRLISLWIGFIHEGVWSGWIFTYDPALKKYSTGHQLLIRMLEASHRLGHRAFDFSIGAQDYKLQYATHGRVLDSIGTPPLGRAAVLLARDMVRQRSPGLFAAALRTKWVLVSAVRRAAAVAATLETS